MRPTSDHRNQIAPPFRPTILQQRFPKHHPAIDLAYWDELRDQLILCGTEIETGTVVNRWHLSVIEFPEYKVAISVLELFAYLINPALLGLDPPATGTEEITILLADCTVKDVGAELGAMIESYGLHQFDRCKLPALMADEYSFLDLTNGERQRNPSDTAADELKYSDKPLSCCEHYSVPKLAVVQRDVQRV